MDLIAPAFLVLTGPDAELFVLVGGFSVRLQHLGVLRNAVKEGRPIGEGEGMQQGVQLGHATDNANKVEGAVEARMQELADRAQSRLAIRQIDLGGRSDRVAKHASRATRSHVVAHRGAAFLSPHALVQRRMEGCARIGGTRGEGGPTPCHFRH